MSVGAADGIHVVHGYVFRIDQLPANPQGCFPEQEFNGETGVAIGAENEPRLARVGPGPAWRLVWQGLLGGTPAATFDHALDRVAQGAECGRRDHVAGNDAAVFHELPEVDIQGGKLSAVIHFCPCFRSRLLLFMRSSCVPESAWRAFRSDAPL